MAPAQRPWRRSSDTGKGACGDDVDVPPAQPAARPAATTTTAALFDDDVPVAVRVTDEFEMLPMEVDVNGPAVEETEPAADAEAAATFWWSTAERDAAAASALFSHAPMAEAPARQGSTRDSYS